MILFPIDAEGASQAPLRFSQHVRQLRQSLWRGTIPLARTYAAPGSNSADALCEQRGVFHCQRYMAPPLAAASFVSTRKLHTHL